MRDIMKSCFFPGGRNYKLLLIFSLVTIVSVQASALTITEDFDSTTTASTTFTTDGILQHTIYNGSGQPATNDLWDINLFSTTGDSFAANALVFTDAQGVVGVQDYITFILGPGEHVESFSVEYINNTMPSAIIVEDENGPDQQDFYNLRSKTTFDTTGMGYGDIQSITLFGYDAAFDNLIVNVVPEPITLSLLGLGGVMLRRRKRK